MNSRFSFRKSSPTCSSRAATIPQRGLTLIEVLIALLVLSIGLVGIAVLHVGSLQNAHSSYYSSIASSVALDFEERLWMAVANRGTGPCLPQADVDDIADDLEALWSGQAPSPATGVAMIIPGLSITTGDIVLGPSEFSWTEVPLELTWLDERFEDQDGSTERFGYTARVVCYDPSDDDDEEVDS